MTNKEKIFSARLVNLLEFYDMTQRELSYKIGISETTISKYIKGRLPKSEILESIAKVLNVTTDYLLGLSDSKTIESNVVPIEIPNDDFLIPVVGEVRAGTPALIMDDCVECMISIDSKYRGKGEFFGLKVKGDSMYPYFIEGAILVCKRVFDIESGKIGVVLVNGDSATVKQVQKSDNGLTLIPLNPKYEPITYSINEIYSKPVQIIAEVIEVRTPINIIERRNK